MKEPANDQPSSCTVRFVTKLPEVVPDQGLAVPSTLSVDGLSDLVNHLVDQDSPIDYDFLIEGEFLRTSLADYITAANLSFESVLTLEYTHRHPAPEPESRLPHPDWISCLAITGSVIYTGCYDNTIRQWTSSSDKPQRQLIVHTGPVKCLAVSSTTLLTGSKDNTVRLWSLDDMSPIAIGSQHDDSVESVAFCPSRQDLFVSGSWHHTIRLWGVGKGRAAPVVKKSKSKRGSETTQTALIERSCLSNVHSQTVSDLCWPDADTIYSVSWDRTLCRIDVNEGTVVQTRTLTDAASSVAFSSSANLIAVGHADRAVRLYDPRLPGAPAKLLRGHQGWVSDLAWAPGSATMLASSSYDCTLKVWDVRSTTPLHTLKADTGAAGAKTLCVDWSKDGVIACGGTDGQLRLHRSKAC